MNEDLVRFLAAHEIMAEDTAVWGRIRLEIKDYLTDQLPPSAFITSVRCIVIQKESVLVVTDRHSAHILPGGRREPGETFTQTLQRELLEETGWTVNNIRLLGVRHFRHLTPKPHQHPYPYPDFLQLIYTATADRFESSAVETDGYEIEASFRSIYEVKQINLPPGEKLFLKAALTLRPPFK